MDVEELLGEVDFSQDTNFEEDDRKGEDFDLEESTLEETFEIVEEQEISLDTIVLKEDMLSETEKDIVYPYILIEGIETQEEFNFLNGLPCRADVLSAFTVVEGSLVPLMQFDFSLQVFLDLHFLGKYRISLQKSKDISVPIDIENPEQLITFIKL